MLQETKEQMLGGLAVDSITTSPLLYNLYDMHPDDGDLNKRENKRRK